MFKERPSRGQRDNNHWLTGIWLSGYLWKLSTASSLRLWRMADRVASNSFGIRSDELRIIEQLRELEKAAASANPR
jgi:hypothetical protein